MWEYPGKALLLIAFFTTTGFSCYKSRTYFDVFTVNCPKCDDYPGGYYKIILEDGKATTVRMECSSSRKFNIQHNSEWGLAIYLERNNGCIENDIPLAVTEMDQEIGAIDISEPPLMDLLKIKIKASEPTPYEFYYSQDQCTLSYYASTSYNPEYQVTVNKDTTLTFAVVPDKELGLMVKKRGEIIYDENLTFQRNPINIEL